MGIELVRKVRQAGGVGPDHPAGGQGRRDQVRQDRVRAPSGSTPTGPAPTSSTSSSSAARTPWSAPTSATSPSSPTRPSSSSTRPRPPTPSDGRPSGSWPARCAPWSTATPRPSRAEQAAAALFGEEVAQLDERTLLDVFADAPSTDRAPQPARRRRACRWSTCWSRPAWSRPRAGPATTIEQGGAYVNNRREDDVDRTLIGPDDLVAGRYLVLRRGKTDYHLVELRLTGAERPAEPAAGDGRTRPGPTLTRHEQPRGPASDVSPVRLTTGLPETVLPEEPEAVRTGLEAALAQPGERRRHAVSDVVRSDPRSLDGLGRPRLAGPGRRGGLRLLPGRATTGASTPCGRRAGRARAWSGGPTSPTGASSGASTASGRRPGPSASTPRRSGAPSSCASSTRRGARTGPGIPA